MIIIIFNGLFVLLTQVNTPERAARNILPKEILDLLNEVKQLRENTQSLVCDCNEPDCPFQEDHCINIDQVEFDLFSESPRSRRNGISKSVHPSSLVMSSSAKGIEKRRDGTIVERDGPRSISSEDSLEKRLRKSHIYSNSLQLGQHLSVSNTMLSDYDDCLVDSDNLYGTSSDDDSTFSRFEVSRKQVKVRRHARPSTKPKRRVSIMCTSCSTLPAQMRKCSIGSDSRRFSQHLRNAASLPSCAFFEDDEMSLSTCSSSSSINTTQHVPCHTSFARQLNGLMITS